MNKKILLPMLFLCIATTGCSNNGDPGKSGSSEPSGTSQTSGSSQQTTSTPQGKLSTPVLEVNAEKTGLSWASIAGAVKYEVKVNDGDPIEASIYSFNTSVGSYSVTVRAIASNAANNSDYSSPFAYTTAETQLGDLVLDNGKITWPSVEGNGVQLYVGDEFVDVPGSSYTPDATNYYTFRVKAGWNDSEKKFYVDGTSIKKTFYYAKPADQKYVLEDATAESDADLQEQYTVQKFVNEWVDSSASITLNSSDNDGYTPGKCVQLNYWRHSAYFKYAKKINLSESRDTLQFYLKGDGVSEMSVAFQIMQDIKVGEMSLKGIYAAYALPTIPNEWKLHTISLNDPAWVVDYAGNKLTFEQVKQTFASSGYLFNTLGDMLTLTDEFQLRVKATADQSWSSTKIWMDEIELNNSHKATSSEDVIALFSSYTGLKDSKFSDVSISGDNITIGTSTGTYTRNNNELNISITSPVTASFVMETSDYGQIYQYKSGEGEVSSFTGMSFIPKVTMIDDFSSYSETGIGEDQGHSDPTQYSGMRARYYSDYYSGSSGSRIGGNGWSLMGSTDYLDLASIGHTDTKSAKYKYNPSNAMRMISGDICSMAQAPAMGKGSTFSFWVKGGTKYDFTIKARIFFEPNQLGPTTHVDDSKSTTKLDITVSQNSDWTEVTVPLNPNKTYYGFSLTTVANWGGSGNDYFYVDDFMIYGSVNPWTIGK